MSKLIEALKRKYKTPEAALRALGLDENLLKSAVTGDAMPSKLSRKTRPARDAAPNKQFEREQLAGPSEDDENDPEGLPPTKLGTIQKSREGEDDEEYPYSAAHAQLADHLKQLGLDDDEVEECCKMASESSDMSMDDPLPFSGRPNPGGQHDPTTNASRTSGATDSMIFKQDGVINSRNIAIALASSMQRDSSVPAQHFGAPTPQSKQARQLANDAARANSSATLADTYSRFPMLARIGRA
jgi:hypothetical protein